jgi:hypothetical protein
VIKLRQRKTGAYVSIPVAAALKVALDAAPRRSPIMLTNSEGGPWSEGGFQSAWARAGARAGICGLTFHDLRGSAVVTLARAGCNEVEKPRLLPRPGERRPGPGVAVAPSRLLARASTCRHCVTRCLNGATHLSRCRNSQCGAVTVARGLNGATRCADWRHGPFATTGPRHSRYIRGVDGNTRA